MATLMRTPQAFEQEATAPLPEELYDRALSTATPAPKPSWQQGYDVPPSLAQVKQAAPDPLVPEIGYGAYLLGGQGLSDLKNAWLKWNQGQVDVPFQFPGAGAVVRGVTPTDTAFVNQMRGWFPKLMSKVDALPDIGFTRGWRQLVTPTNEARALGEYRQPPLPGTGGAIELGRPFELKGGKWAVESKESAASGQTPIPTEYREKTNEIKSFIHEALHALYWHKNRGLSQLGKGRLETELEGAVPAMSFHQARDFMKQMVDEGYLTQARLDQMVDTLNQPRHGALDAMAEKIVRDTFSPEVRNQRIARERATEAVRKNLIPPYRGQVTAEWEGLRQSVNRGTLKRAGIGPERYEEFGVTRW